MAEQTSELPITGVCIVAGTCPTGYTMISACQDRPTTEALLWKDTSLFAKKARRLMCYTTAFPLNNGNFVLIDVVIQDDTQPPPAGFSSLTTTQDTGEPATNKKVIYCKLVPRSTTEHAITNIAFLCKTRKPPQDYCITGEINGLILCYKVGSVPRPAAALNAPLPPPVTNTPHGASGPTSLMSYTAGVPQGPTPILASMYASSTSSAPGQSTNHTGGPHTLLREQTKLSPLTGVPFELCTQLKNARRSSIPSSNSASSFVYKSPFDLNRKYNYTFEVEANAAHHMPDLG